MSKKKVFLDAGHGGRDPGACGNGFKEKDRALDYTLEIGKELEKHGVNVVYSRTTDKFVELKYRARMANAVNADLFISIHLNSYKVSEAQGFEIYNYRGSVKGKELSTNILSSIVKDNLYTKDRGVKSANFAVLRKTEAPASLIELGFISNKEDVKLLADKQVEIVQAITKGVLKSLDVKYKEEDLKPTNEEIRGDNKVKVNFKGKNIEVDGKMIDNTNYISIREVFEKLGHEVSWDKENKVVIIK